MSNSLDSIKQSSTIVADTANVALLKSYAAEDATTNPSLVLQVCKAPEYASIITKCITEGKATPCTGTPVEDDILDRIAVAFGCEILKHVPGYVSTEVCPSLSFDRDASVAKARRLIALYKEKGVGKEKILIKMAATWEGIEASKILEVEGIKTNMTLIFSFHQAVACAQAGAFLISPFVGRILDWYKKHQPTEDFSGMNDPGVQSVSRVYNYFRKYDYKTVVMGASFRNIEEVYNLAGCDKLTVGPALLELMQKDTKAVERKLSPESAKAMDVGPNTILTEAMFRWELNQCQMSTDKLSEGIRNFEKDYQTLRKMISDTM